MSSAGINFGGLASGLDTKAIISALMAVERRPIAALETKKTSLSSQKRLFGDFNTLLTDLQKSAKKLSRTTDFLKMAATSSDENILTVSAGSGATPGSHQITVEKLARAQLNVSGRYADDDALSFGPGTLLLNMGGNDYAIEIDANSSLNMIAAAINEQADVQDIAISAQVVDTGDLSNGGANRYQMVLRGTKVGSEGAFTLIADNGDSDLNTLVDQLTTVNDPNFGITNASNAEFVLDGVHMQRSANSITDAITGVTLDLHALDPLKTVTVTVTTDAAETSKSVSDFVEAYNKVVDFVAAQNVVGTDGRASAPLFGDGTLRSIRSGLRQILGAEVDTGNDALSMLSQIGITSDRAGKLTFSQSKFEEQLGVDEDAIGALFADATFGIAGRLSTQIDVFVNTTDGLIKARQDGFDRRIKDTQSRIDQGELRLQRTQAALELRYANLESLLGKLQSQGNALSSINSRTN